MLQKLPRPPEIQWVLFFLVSCANICGLLLSSWGRHQLPVKCAIRSLSWLLEICGMHMPKTTVLHQSKLLLRSQWIMRGNDVSGSSRCHTLRLFRVALSLWHRVVSFSRWHGLMATCTNFYCLHYSIFTFTGYILSICFFGSHFLIHWTVGLHIKSNMSVLQISIFFYCQ